MRKLAIIGGGRMAGIFATEAKKMNVETFCFSLEKGIFDKSLFDHLYFVNILDKDSVTKICKEIGIDGVVPTTELTIATAAYVANQLGLNGLDYEVSTKITDKSRNREKIMNIEGLTNPRYDTVTSVEQIIEHNYTFPIILKPTSKGGKRGITVVYKKENLEDAFKYALSESNNELPIIVEEYIDGGMECSVESLSYKGDNYIVQITEKITSGAPHCVELAHHQPANISDEIRLKIERVLDEALTCIGVSYGACHTEIKIKENKIYLIEFNARPGGDHIASPLTELSTGYSYIRGAIEIALDTFSKIDKSKFLNKCAGVIFITEQNKEFLPLFEKCELYPWCYKKNNVSENLQSIKHNDGFNINYIMYCYDKKPDFEKLNNEEK